MSVTHQSHNRIGKLVTPSSYEVLSPKGFAATPENAAIFAKNLARYFLEGRKEFGTFALIKYGQAMMDDFRETLRRAGHETIDVDPGKPGRDTLNDLLETTDGVFQFGWPSTFTSSDLIEFVLKGGSLYQWGNPQHVNTLLGSFGASMWGGPSNNPQGTKIPISGDHEIFDGVTDLYVANSKRLQLLSQPTYANTHVAVPDDLNPGFFHFIISEALTARGSELGSGDMPEWNDYANHIRWQDGFLALVLGYNSPPSDSADGKWKEEIVGEEAVTEYGTGSCRLWLKNISDVDIYVHKIRMSNSISVEGDLGDFYDIYFSETANANNGNDRLNIFQDLSLQPGDSPPSEVFHWGLRRDAGSNSTGIVPLDLSLAALPNYRLDYTPRSALRSPFKFAMPPISKPPKAR